MSDVVSSSGILSHLIILIWLDGRMGAWKPAQFSQSDYCQMHLQGYGDRWIFLFSSRRWVKLAHLEKQAMFQSLLRFHLGFVVQNIFDITIYRKCSVSDICKIFAKHSSVFVFKLGESIPSVYGLHPKVPNVFHQSINKRLLVSLEKLESFLWLFFFFFCRWGGLLNNTCLKHKGEKPCCKTYWFLPLCLF